MRLLLPALRIHQNSVPLDPGDPLLQEGPLPAAVLCLVLAAVGTCAAIFTPRRKQPLRLRLRQGDTHKDAGAITAGGEWTLSLIHI